MALDSAPMYAFVTFATSPPNQITRSGRCNVPAPDQSKVLARNNQFSATASSYGDEATCPSAVGRNHSRHTSSYVFGKSERSRQSSNTSACRK
jgi:hypothetical protein